jgi:hypothetical protein
MSRKLHRNYGFKSTTIILLFIIISVCTVTGFLATKHVSNPTNILPSRDLTKWKLYSNQSFSFKYPDTWNITALSTADKLIFEACSLPVFSLSRISAVSLEQYKNSFPRPADTSGNYFFTGHLAYIYFTYDFPKHPERQLPPEKITAYIPPLKSILELNFASNCGQEFNDSISYEYNPLISSFKIADQIPDSSWKTYVNSQYHFSFQYPPDLIIDTENLGFWGHNKQDYHLLIRDPNLKPSLMAMSITKEYDGFYLAILHTSDTKGHNQAIRPDISYFKSNELFTQLVNIDKLGDIEIVSRLSQLSEPNLIAHSFTRFEYNGNTFSFDTGYPVETLKAILSSFTLLD